MIVIKINGCDEDGKEEEQRLNGRAF